MILPDIRYTCPFCKKEKKSKSKTIICTYDQYFSMNGIWYFTGLMYCELCDRRWTANIEIKDNVTMEEEKNLKEQQNDNV